MPCRCRKLGVQRGARIIKMRHSDKMLELDEKFGSCFKIFLYLHDLLSNKVVD